MSIGPVVVKGIDLTTIQGRRVVARALLRANSPPPARARPGSRTARRYS